MQRFHATFSWLVFAGLAFAAAYFHSYWQVFLPPGGDLGSFLEVSLVVVGGLAVLIAAMFASQAR